MRNIKFRGKDILHKSWQYGSLAKDEPQKAYYIIDNEYGRGIDVDENTVGQYTGLKDKNGKEIYEGDIIQYEDITKGLVRYSEKYAQYVLVDTGSLKDEFEPLGDYNMEVFKIIGNEFDNPDLLEKGAEDE